jgi:two-component system, NtrC family, sensor kinase
MKKEYVMFNGDFKTNFDHTLPKNYVIPKDIGSVLLNLINNVFYAVHLETRRAVFQIHTS